MKKNKIKVLYVGPLGFRPGVWETRASYIFPNLFDPILEDTEIVLLTGRIPDFARPTLSALCKKYFIQHRESDPKKGKITPHDYWYDEIYKAARSKRPDIITNIFAPATLGKAMSLVGKSFGARVVLRVAGDEIGSRIAMGLYDDNHEFMVQDIQNESSGYKLADSIIVMSPWEQERVAFMLPPAERTKIKICIRGIDLSRFKYGYKNYYINPVSRYLFVGRKSKEKGYDLLETAAKTVLKKNAHIEFVFAGSFDKAIYENRNYIGWVDDNNLPKIYEESDAFILCSRSEGFPQVLAEAMASGLPCIISKHLFENFFRDKKNALLVGLDAEDIANAVLNLHNNPGLASNLSEQSRKFAEQKLDKKIWAGLYKKLLLGENMPEKTLFEYNKDKIDNENEPFESNSESRTCSNSSIDVSNNLDIGSSVTNNLDRQLFLIYILILHDNYSYFDTKNLCQFAVNISAKGYLTYLAFPNTIYPNIKLNNNLVLFPYTSLEAVKYQIMHLDLGILFLSTSLIDHKSLSYILEDIDKHFVIKILARNRSGLIIDTVRGPSLDYSDVLKAWKTEIFLSNAIRIILEHAAENCFSDGFFNNKIRYIKSYEQLESIFHELIECKADINRLPTDQSELDFERALHARRMIKILSNLKKG
jgi:glycosyltransferase involved in cell wall biosynthesis